MYLCAGSALPAAVFYLHEIRLIGQPITTGGSLPQLAGGNDKRMNLRHSGRNLSFKPVKTKLVLPCAIREEPLKPPKPEHCIAVTRLYT